MEVSGQRKIPAALPQGKRGWVGSRAGLDGYYKSRSPLRHSITELSSLYVVGRYADWVTRAFLFCCTLACCLAVRGLSQHVNK